jgi:TolA-binding protein
MNDGSSLDCYDVYGDLSTDTVTRHMVNYVRENYKDAAKNYLSIYLEHPNSSKAPNGLLKLGISLIKMGQLEQGCASLVKLRISYPETDKSLLDRGDIEIQRNGCKTS